MNGKTTGGFAAFVFLAFFVCLVLGMGQCAPGPENEASATNAAGQKVNVVVCCGYVLKGCTVRTP